MRRKLVVVISCIRGRTAAAVINTAAVACKQNLGAVRAFCTPRHFNLDYVWQFRKTPQIEGLTFTTAFSFQPSGRADVVRYCRFFLNVSGSKQGPANGLHDAFCAAFWPSALPRHSSSCSNMNRVVCRFILPCDLQRVTMLRKLKHKLNLCSVFSVCSCSSGQRTKVSSKAVCRPASPASVRKSQKHLDFL
jgi:hypothetical protein